MYRYRRPLSKDLLFLFAIVLGWILWWRTHHGAYLPEDNEVRNAYLSWTIADGIATITFLYWADFFRPFRPFRFIGDYLTIFFVVLAMGLLTKPIVSLLLQQYPALRGREVLAGAFLPSLMAVLMEGLAIWVRTKNSIKKSVYLALTDGESERFLETVQRGGWDRYYRVLSLEEFNGALATSGRVDYVVISRVATKNFIAHQNILQAQMQGVSILDYNTLLNQMRGHISIHHTDIWTFLAGAERQNSIRIFYRELKFYTEPLVAAILLLLLAPVFIVVAILIKATSPGPVFFSQRRTGYLGVEFNLVKFRSMRVDAESKGAQWATKADTRVTPIGRILRKTRIDELPQFWNVLCGEMSFLGPRPERPEFYEIITRQVPIFKLRLMVRPGITGWAQLLGGYASTIEESERKLEYDLFYMQYLSPRMDIFIVAKTVLALLKGDSGQ